jgi:hypothetical protein
LAKRCGAVPFSDLERRETFLRSTHMIGDHSDGVIEPHDHTHAFDSPGSGIIYAFHDVTLPASIDISASSGLPCAISRQDAN